MKKYLTLILVLTLCLGLTVPSFAANYESKTYDCWWNSDGATVTVDKVRVENYENHVPVGATITYKAANEGPLCIGRDYYFDGVNQTTVHWCYDPTTGTMIKEPTGDTFIGHPNCPKLAAGGTYTFTITEEMAESLSLFSKITEESMYDRSGVSIEAGYSSDMGPEIGTEFLVIDAPAAKPAEPVNPFKDVPTGAYYHDAVLWALEKGITTGTSATTFGPTATCTRGQVATFLWRAKGCPEPATSVNPFADVKESDYFYKPVLWAYENGITTGTSGTTFSPDATCTSGQVVTFLWRANGKPAAATTGTEYYAEAVAWGNANELLAGTDVPFAPDNQSPRADIVTYLYRDLAD